jgi:hypothetical protein
MPIKRRSGLERDRLEDRRGKAPIDFEVAMFLPVAASTVAIGSPDPRASLIKYLCNDGSL